MDFAEKGEIASRLFWKKFKKEKNISEKKRFLSEKEAKPYVKQILSSINYSKIFLISS